MPSFIEADFVRMARRDRAHWDKHGYGPWAVREREGGAFVGRGGLAWATVAGGREVELPWAVQPRLQNQGYATEMALAAIDTAREVGLERVVSLTLPTNFASRRIMEKAGLTFVAEIEHVGLPHLLFELDL
jgi:ribosomal-protein-alanine N-acetyltransferase